ncbi:hypothetical protein FNF29_03789 [Cafeteria roenbergensis]|uniref:RING-type domain-containing protein n=1 Tax=Cafeteria roenbergensis TaxID=33653 RepID=A0A5A8CHP2_CAFRO|nr:hypothetical protein FNF29_03789 [Cafeteria roenbergensis]|eukprot:KAA0152562.1 hypothetical protein FNF29_03789 [Cafeteria roenbergensis]
MGCEHLLCQACASSAFAGAGAPECPVCNVPTANSVLQVPVIQPSPALDDAAWFYILTRPAMAMKLLQASMRFHK